MGSPGVERTVMKMLEGCGQRTGSAASALVAAVADWEDDVETTYERYDFACLLACLLSAWSLGTGHGLHWVAGGWHTWKRSARAWHVGQSF